MTVKQIKKYLFRLKEYWYYSTRTALLAYRSNKSANLIKTGGVIITALIPIAHSYLIKLIIDDIVLISQKKTAFDINSLVRTIIAFFTLQLISRLSWRIIDYCDRVSYLDFGRFLTIKVNEKFSSLDFEHWEDPKLNNILNKVRETYSWRPINFASRQIWFLQNLVSVISNALVIIGLGPFYFLLIFISTIPEFLVGLKFSRSVWNIHGAQGPIRRDFWNTSHYLGNDKYLQEIHILGIQGKLLRRIEKLYKKFFGYQKIAIKKMTKNRIIASMFGLVTNVFVIGSVFFKTINGLISIGSLNFYVSRANGLAESFKAMFRNLSENFEDLLYVKDLFIILNLKPKINKNLKGIKIKPPFKVEFKDVWFKYPNSKKYVLKNFNLTIEPNQKIALIGKNGAGKTTIIKLLVRFYDINRGKILINGKDLNNINLNHWRKNIGALFQDFNRYAYTVRENIRLGDVDKPFEQEIFNQAIKKSGANQFIKNLSKKEATVLSKQFENGTDLSTGEWQKIALSRAFFRDAPLLILDEPTSAIDAQSEYKIFQQIDRFEKNKSVIMISHRFSTVRNANKIYVIDKGKIIEGGSHRQLIEQNSRYAKLFRLQAKGYQA